MEEIVLKLSHTFDGLGLGKEHYIHRVEGETRGVQTFP